MIDDSDLGGDAPCWAHLLDEFDGDAEADPASDLRIESSSQATSSSSVIAEPRITQTS